MQKEALFSFLVILKLLWQRMSDSLVRVPRRAEWGARKSAPRKLVLIAKRMTSQVSYGPSTLPLLVSNSTNKEITRKSAAFHLDIWGDQFIKSTSDNKIAKVCMEQEIEELKEKVRMLMLSSDKTSERIYLIDALQRLGVSYHFERAIEESLQQVYATLSEHDDDDSLNFVALRFRLLRQQGYNISSDVFQKFTDSKGKFKDALLKDIPSILSLYEASHLRVHGEDILDEALDFTTTHLEILAKDLSLPLATQVSHALKQALYKGIPRLEVIRYISIYQEDESLNEVLLKLAKLDFNLVQLLHQEELSQISKWWKDLDFASKLPFARDRIVECYLWALATYFEPKYSLGRRMFSKLTCILVIIDDIYDVYGTIEELDLFTEAINRWDIGAIDQLPQYMKLCYQALLDFYNEVEQEMMKEGRSYCVNHAKDVMKSHVRAYHHEAQLLHKGYIPTFDEYLEVALVTAGSILLATISFLGMGEIATKEVFDWIVNNPKIVRLSNTISRLMNDIVSHKFEQMRGHVASSVECYMKQYGVSEQEAVNELRKIITNAWKDLNKEMLKPFEVQMPLLTRVLNLTRMIDSTYKDEDGFTHSEIVLKDHIMLLLVDPLTI